jgi:hypothetical protein
VNKYFFTIYSLTRFFYRSHFNSVIPEGIQTTILRAGVNILFLKQVCFYKQTNHFSEASKSAITPSFKGLIVLMFSCVFPASSWLLYQQQ